jgi:UDP-glucose 4-epimerase
MLTPNALNAYRGRSVLVTGGLGFIGSNLAHRLVEIGDVEVALIDSLVEEQGGNLFNVEDIKDRVSIHIADLEDSSLVSHLVAGVDYIFNLAGNVSHLDSMSFPLRDLELNCAAQLSLLEACRSFNPHARIVFTSTRQVYGKPLYLPFDEEHRCAPVDINGVHKLAAEQYHLLYHRAYGVRATCLRLTNTYGPRQLMGHNRQSVIAWFIRRALDGQPIELFGEGRQKRDFNYVDDVVEALLMVGASEKTEGEVYNLGSPEPVTLAHLAEELIWLTGKGSLSYVPFPPERQLIDIGNCYSSYRKIAEDAGWEPSVNLRDGLERTVEYYRKHQVHYWKENVDPVPRSLTRA